MSNSCEQIPPASRPNSCEQSSPALHPKYDDPNNYDSPFHRMAESSIDRQIKAVKTKFVEELKSRIQLNETLVHYVITHPELTVNVYIELHVRTKTGTIYKVVLLYDMTSHKIQKWWNGYLNSAFVLNNLRSLMQNSPAINTVIFEVIKSAFEANMLPGLGTSKGSDWNAEDTAENYAQSELGNIV